MIYKLFTKTAQSSGPENISSERLDSSLLAPGPVLSSSRITPEYNGKILPQPDGEKRSRWASGGADATAVKPSLIAGAS